MATLLTGFLQGLGLTLAIVGAFAFWAALACAAWMLFLLMLRQAAAAVRKPEPKAQQVVTPPAPFQRRFRRVARHNRFITGVQKKSVKPVSTATGLALFIVFLTLLCINGWGCASQPPPDHVSIQPGFSEAETTVIRSALDAWCEAVGWCPPDAIWVDRGRIELVDHIDQGDAPKLCSPGKTCQVSAENDGDNVNVLRDRHVRDLDTLWIEVAHEIGHYCTGHTATGLMSAVHDDGEPLVIDDVAIAAWRAGCP